jgi:hypothetical protein
MLVVAKIRKAMFSAQMINAERKKQPCNLVSELPHAKRAKRHQVMLVSIVTDWYHGLQGRLLIFSPVSA